MSRLHNVRPSLVHALDHRVGPSSSYSFFDSRDDPTN